MSKIEEVQMMIRRDMNFNVSRWSCRTSSTMRRKRGIVSSPRSIEISTVNLRNW